MFHFNTTIRFGAEKSSNSTGNAKPNQTIIQAPNSATSVHKSQASKDSLPKDSPVPLGVKSQDVAKASPPEISPPQPKSLPDQVKSMSDVERNNLIAKLIDVVGKQQAQLNEQQSLLDDYFQDQQHLNASAHKPFEAQVAQVNHGPIHNPFTKPEYPAAAKTMAASEAAFKKTIRFLSTLFPTKYLKNLPMNFLESLVQSTGSTLGSRTAETVHDKYIHPVFFKKPPPPKKSPVKDAFKDASRLAPEFFFRSVIDSTINRFTHKLIP